MPGSDVHPWSPGAVSAHQRGRIGERVAFRERLSRKQTNKQTNKPFFRKPELKPKI